MTMSPSTRKSGVLYNLFLFAGIISAFVYFGLEKEKTQYKHAQSTLKVYSSPGPVCANHQHGQSTNFTTVQSHVEAKDQNMQIVHCGECGHCSTNNDIKIMKDTKETLTRTATICAFFSLFLGEKATEACLEARIGFTPACSSCWSDNVRCSRKNCRFTCLKSLMLREPHNHGGIYLNSCLECDEKLCGPAFIQCAGANRRRLGIVSDIKRDAEHEQCKLVDYEVME